MNVEMIDPEKISIGTINSRQDLGDLSALAHSIKTRIEAGKRGVILPLLVRRLEGNDNYDWELIDGRRRLHASLMLGLPGVPVVDESDEENILELKWMSRISNKLRKEWSWVENAKFYIEMSEAGLTHEEIAIRDGVSRITVTQHINAYNAINECPQGTLLDYTIAREISQKCPKEDVIEFVNYAIENKLNREDVTKVLFALNRFKSDQELLKAFEPNIYRELQETYYPHRFNPKALNRYEEERKLLTRDLRPEDRYLDISKYPTRESAEEYATKHQGEVIERIKVEGWHLYCMPYNREEIREKLAKLVERE